VFVLLLHAVFLFFGERVLWLLFLGFVVFVFPNKEYLLDMFAILTCNQLKT